MQNQTIHDILRLYFESQASYRAVGHRLHIEAKTAHRHVITLGENCKTPLEVNCELKPNWSGFLLLDGNEIIVGKGSESLLIGADALSQDVVHATLAPGEDGAQWTAFIKDIIEPPISYPLKGIITDGNLGLIKALRLLVPDIPYQACVRHFEQELIRYIRYQFIQKSGFWRETDRFLAVVAKVLYAPDIKVAETFRDAMVSDPGFAQAGLSRLVGKIVTCFDDLTRHHLYPGMPRTSNIIEGINSRMDSKINQADGYGSHDTAWATLKLLIMCYRFKKFTDSRTNENNGKSPLELAGVKTANINWINFSQRRIEKN